jgi:hypothetical protein
MLSPRLRLWQMLRDEYESFHGARPDIIHNWSFQPEQLKHPVQLALRLHQPADKVSRELLGKLNQNSQNELQNLDDSRHPSAALQDDLLAGLNTLLADPNLYQLYDQGVVAHILSEAETGVEFNGLKDTPLPGNSLAQVNRWLLEETYADEVESIDQSITKNYYAAINARNHSALCLSGGGIRTATFNLGILQGLARHGLLEKFDYLSTVSGGGYTGGWLSAWIHRQGLKRVVSQLSNPPLSPIEPEPRELVHLRAFSNYLSPRLGLMSADTWTMIATLLRNIILNWLVLVPLLVALLIFPRMWLSFLYHNPLESLALAFKSTFNFPLSLAVGFVANIIALTYIGLNLPSSGLSKGERPRLLWSPLLLPLLVSVMALTTFWARDENRLGVGWWAVILYAEALIVIPVIICFGYRLLRVQNKLETFFQVLGLIALLGIAQFMIGSIAWLGATKIPFFASPHEHIIPYSCLAVPLLLGLLLIGGTFISGLTSRYTEDDDQEWWARSGAFIYIVILAWIVFCALVLYGPYLFVWLTESSWKLWIARIGTAAGVVSGAISLSGGFSSKTPANADGKGKADSGGMALHALTNLLGPVFLAFIFILLSFTAGWLLTLSASLPDSLKLKLNVVPEMPTQAIDHLGILLHSSLRLLASLFLLLTTLGLLMGRAISTNKFSLHYFWRNRIIRAYMGASHFPRNPNPFTGFDTNDNVYMHELRPHQPGSPVLNPPTQRETKLLHVLNVALNLSGSHKLAWQERKAESFTISPLHAGNYMLGYRKALNYGRQPYNGRQGISLGTSVAMSGAFASPNMGYMMTSPVVRFLMTLFNVRFGWWLGNPGRAGDGGLPFGRTYDRDSPRLSVTPIFQEALGLTDDQAGYVYLSDGGHFENLGLYEMVLRRCRLVVIGDGSSDEEYTFQSLGLAIRQIRIDLGVPITFEKFQITGRLKDGGGAYCAIGKIRYACVDGDQVEDGNLIIIKATLTGNEPRDVLNYASEHTSFPQEFIGDQWFSESQFESYRALGSHIVDVICREGGQIEDRNSFSDLEAFKDNLESTLEKVSLTDFEQNLLSNLKEIPKSIDGVLSYLKASKPKDG